MAKKIHHRKTKKSPFTSWSMTIRHYFRTLFLSLFVGAVVFMGGEYFLKPSVPCANSLSCDSDLSEKIENGEVGIFEGHKVMAPPIDLAYEKNRLSVLGANAPNPQKHVYIDLSSQTIYAYDGNTKFFQTFISSGRWNKTPIGNFHIWEKLRSTRMSGGEGADAYNLPNVPYVMYFYHDFGLHGAYWHDNFGYTMSHGCVNMRQVDAQVLYDWADGPLNGQQGTAVSTCNHFIEPNTCIQDNPINS